MENTTNDSRKILITGGAGGVGAIVARRFAAAGHSVRIFDLPTVTNKKEFPADEPGIELFWGDISDTAALAAAMKNVSEVIHLAALVVPATEKNPQLARKVNVDGTLNVAEAALTQSEKSASPITLRFSSSATVFGITNHLTPPVPPDHPVSPTDNYTETKILAEEIVRNSGLPWSIYRFAAAQYLQIRKGNFSQMRIIPPDNRIEFVHIQDIADAFLNSIANPETIGKTFILAGGPRCQMLYRHELLRTFGLLGFPAPNWRKFTDKPFPLDWYDTTETQRVLKFQNRSFDDYLKDFRANLGFQYHALRYGAAPLMQILRIHI